MEAYLDSQSAPHGDVLACIWVPIHGKLGLELDNILPLAVWLDGLKVLEVALLIFFSRFKKEISQEDVVHDAAKGADPVVLGCRGNGHFCSSIQQMDSETLVSI